MRRWCLAGGILVASCHDAVALHSGLDQPVRVEDAFFLEGELPIADDGPAMTSVASTNTVALLGQRDRSLGGRTDEAAYAVGLRFASLGSGWWVHEVGDLAALFPGERDVSLRYDLGTGIPEGLHALRLAAIDGDGRRGPAFDIDVCVLEDPATTGLNPCDPDVPPPAVVIAATWNRAVDLDLVVEAPDGKRVRWKSPTSAQPDGGVVPPASLDDPTVARLDRDSNAGCLADGRNAEAVVWREPPPSGTWSAYVDLFDACGEPDVSFDVVVYRRRQRDDGSYRLVETDRRTGTLIAEFDAYGGAKPPLFVLGTELP